MDKEEFAQKVANAGVGIALNFLDNPHLSNSEKLDFLSMAVTAITLTFYNSEYQKSLNKAIEMSNFKELRKDIQRDVLYMIEGIENEEKSRFN